ncbi:hypothetical protein CHARACLAT_032541 [Characodon lateralis]|uniref:Uncharacterized protein n=1 Tax=Characodon lateralis TaxID=208331 RepID=A0ABU7EPS7_9TELE|nr:hypothetical protein [Characodon lateralis]
MEVQFGLYRGQTFRWLLTHDLGYTVGLLASHEAEREAGCSSSPLLCNKDALLEYARLFKEVTAAIVDKRWTGFACSSRAGSQAASCTTRAASPSPQRQSYTSRKKRAMVLYISLEEDDLLMVEAASAVEQELSASAPSSASRLLTPSPSADKPSAPAAQVVLLESWKSSLPPEEQE